MTPRLLVATDFSTAAAAALDQGRRLGDQLRFDVEVLHVAEDYNADEWRHQPSARTWLDTTGTPEAEVVTRSGIPWVEVARRADEIGATLVVIGSHGRSGYHPLRLGSTAERLGSTSPCPVVLVSARQRSPASKPGVPG